VRHLSEERDRLAHLGGEVELTQKLDGAAVVLRREEGGCRFYGREMRHEIDAVRRTVTDMYEKGMEHLESRDLGALPDGSVVHLEYFGPRVKPIIPVVNAPRNYFVVVQAEGVSPAEAAELLDVSPPPVVHKGRLSPDQVDALAGGVFSPTVRAAFPFDYLVNPEVVEGLVLRTDRGALFKVVDPEFTREVCSKKEACAEFREYQRLLAKMLLELEVRVPRGYVFSPQGYLDAMFDNILRAKEWLKSCTGKFMRWEGGSRFETEFSYINSENVPKELNFIYLRRYLTDFTRMALTHLYVEKRRASVLWKRDEINILNEKVRMLRTNEAVPLREESPRGQEPTDR
jgi:hypothetical protein